MHSDRKSIGIYERIFSDHMDFIEPEAFDGQIRSCIVVSQSQTSQ